MTIVVAYKYAANPQDASVGADGRVDWSRAKEAVSEYDPIAIQVGRQLADGLGTGLVGITVGSASAGTSLAKKGALSRGLDRASLSRTTRPVAGFRPRSDPRWRASSSALVMSTWC